VADLEERRYREALIQLCAQAGERLVGEEHIPLDLFRDVVHCAWIAQPKCCSSLLKGSVCVKEDVEDAIGLGRRRR